VLNIIDSSTTNFLRSVNCRYPINGYIVSKTKLNDFKVICSPISEKLNRYSLDGDYIDSFDTVKDAKSKLGLSLCSISSAIRSGRTCNGFYWTRSNNPDKKIFVKTKISRKKIVVVEHLDTGEIETFDSINEASKKYKSVRYILNGRCNSPHNLKFNIKI